MDSLWKMSEIGPQALVSKFGIDLGRKMLVRIVGELNTTPTEYTKLLKEFGYKMVRIVDWRSSWESSQVGLS
jgi:hypothetical protein